MGSCWCTIIIFDHERHTLRSNGGRSTCSLQKALEKVSMACTLAQSSKGTRRRLSSLVGSWCTIQVIKLDHERHALKSNDRSTCCSFLESSTQSKHDIGYRRITVVGIMVHNDSDWKRHILKSNDRSTCCSFLESSTQSKHAGVYIGSKTDTGNRLSTVVVRS